MGPPQSAGMAELDGVSPATAAWDPRAVSRHPQSSPCRWLQAPDDDGCGPRQGDRWATSLGELNLLADLEFSFLTLPW